jgi:hypothetical protein
VGSDVHVEGDAVVDAAGHAGDVGRVEFPGEQGGGAEHVPQAVPGPHAVAVGIAPSGLRVGRLQDSTVEVRRPPVPVSATREDQSERITPGLLLGAGLPDAGSERSASG